VRPEGICRVTGKVGYANEGCARTMLAYFRDQGRELTRIYECRRCGNWHLTSVDLYRFGGDQRSPRQRVLTWLRLARGIA
jgi:hypothetical protein